MNDELRERIRDREQELLQQDKRMRVGTRHVRFTYVGLTSLHPTEVPL